MNFVKINGVGINIQKLNECLMVVYPSDSHRFKYSEQIDMDNLYSFYYLENNGKVLGRFALYDNQFLRYKDQKTLCIGNFECINDTLVSAELINNAKNIAKNAGAAYLVGPMNGSTWMDYRFKTDNKEPLYFMEPENPLYYNNLFLNNGFSVISTYKTFEQNNLESISEKMAGHKLRFEELGVKFRNFSKKNPAEEIRKIYEASLVFFQKNFLFTPVSWKVFLSKYEKLLPFLDLETQIIAEDSDNNLIGFLFSVKDFYCKTKQRLIGKTIAVSSAPKYKGLGIVMASMLVDIALQKKFDSLLYAFVIDNSYSSNFSAKATDIYRNYALYGTEL